MRNRHRRDQAGGGPDAQAPAGDTDSDPAHGATKTDPAHGEPDTARAGAGPGAAAAAESATATAGSGRRASRRRRRLFTWRRLAVCVTGLCALPTGAFTVLYLAIDVPSPNELAKAESNVYLFSDGTHLTSTGDINRESVPLARVPRKVRLAFVAAENKDFYGDPGISVAGMVRGVAGTLTGHGTQGGSTITQQFVKNYYLSQEQTVTRKVKELIISLKVDRRSSKDDILAGYLNSSYYGRLAYGIQAAARAYYHRDVGDLTVEQGAYLAAVLQAPSQYDWASAGPEGRRLVRARWDYVLDNMVGQGWLDRAERARMRFPVPKAPHPTAGLAGQNGYLVDVARRELMASGVSEQELAAGGWRITLSVDPARQRALEKAVAAGLGDRPGRSGGFGPSGAGRDRQAGAVSVDPRSGRIVALYGGRDYVTHYLDNATRSDYQAGPTLRPLSFAAAIQGRAEDEALRYGAPDGRSGPDEARELRRMAVALGISPRASGLGSPRATALGLVGVSPMEMAGAYATFQHEGRKVTPSIVVSARRDGRVVPLRRAVGSPVIGGKAAAAGATPLTTAGRTDDGKAEWFIGSTPELVTSVALFGEDARTHRQVPLTTPKGHGTTAGIWSSYTGRPVTPAPSGPPPAPFEQAGVHEDAYRDASADGW
ncbi:transglycosylase domain-containing protein [Streptomyces sp. NPDC002004]